MLPYGALWKLDQTLHPAAAPRARTPELRRRRALFLFLLAALLSLIFLVPFHGAYLRRVYTQRAREAAGLSTPERDLAEVQRQREAALVTLRDWAGEKGIVPVLSIAGGVPQPEEQLSHGGPSGKEKALNEAFTRVLYFTQKEALVRNATSGLPRQVDCPVARQLAGEGAGTLWAAPETAVV